ncbi:MAG: hypothetical protein HLUCCO16_21265 [Phormidium sp. OSCR]|nr:MAG: hypothetical protein HLUCCO16_21265 [Phormidium sp. OSCR]
MSIGTAAAPGTFGCFDTFDFLGLHGVVGCIPTSFNSWILPTRLNEPERTDSGSLLVNCPTWVQATTHPCILKNRVDRHTLGRKRPLPLLKYNLGISSSIRIGLDMFA